DLHGRSSGFRGREGFDVHVPGPADVLHPPPGDLGEIPDAAGRHDSTEELGEDDLPALDGPHRPLHGRGVERFGDGLARPVCGDPMRLAARRVICRSVTGEVYVIPLDARPVQPPHHLGKRDLPLERLSLALLHHCDTFLTRHDSPFFCWGYSTGTFFN